MNPLTDPLHIKNFMRAAGIKPKDYLGQNFLIDERALENIILAAELKKTDTVLEVGPGLGVLTTELVKRAGEVIAVEKDKNLLPILKGPGMELQKVKFVEQDILKVNLSELISGPYKVVANIPYYLTSKLFQILLESENQPEVLVLMVQKEVGQRVTAQAGELSVLGISVQIYADAEIVAHVPKTSFWPAPEVDSVILKIRPRVKYPEIDDLKLFFRIVKIAFAGKRKQIHNTLGNGLHLEKENLNKILTNAKIDGVMRPQDLEIGDWIRLYQQIKSVTEK